MRDDYIILSTCLQMSSSGRRSSKSKDAEHERHTSHKRGRILLILLDSITPFYSTKPDSFSPEQLGYKTTPQVPACLQCTVNSLPIDNCLPMLFSWKEMLSRVFPHLFILESFLYPM